MLKIHAIILIILTINANFLVIANSEKEKQEKMKRRTLIEPVMTSLTIMSFSFIIGFISGCFQWRKDPDYQQIVYKSKSLNTAGFSDVLNSFYAKMYANEIANRCIYIARSSKVPEDIENVDYFLELCSAWSKFTLNHINTSIKYYDVVYNIQFFEVALMSKHISKMSEKNPSTAYLRNKRFVDLITSEIEGHRKDVINVYRQTGPLRLMNSFYGAFWGVIFKDMFSKDLKPRRFKITDYKKVEDTPSSGFFSCFGCSGRY